MRRKAHITLQGFMPHYKKYGLMFLVTFAVTWSMAYALPQSFAPIVRKVLPAVVSIQTTLKPQQSSGAVQNFDVPQEFAPFFENFFGRNMNPEPRVARRVLGSGFIIDKKGLVVTNNHVIKGADQVQVTLENGNVYAATIVGKDALSDIAVLKIKDIKNPLPTVSFGDSNTVQVGDWVLAIGNPLALGGSVTKGIISARGRNINMGSFDDFLQTDAPINHGNSGGPLIDMKGRVVGINSAIVSPTNGSVGLGFAIPSSIAKRVVSQLAKKGVVRWPWIGVRFKRIDDQIADSLGLKKSVGVLIVSVEAHSPAQRAGIKSGDVLLTFDGRLLTKHKRLPILVMNTPIGKKVQITVFRKGKKMTLTLQLAERSRALLASKVEVAKTGIYVQNITDDLRERYRIDKSVKGVVIVGIRGDSTLFDTVGYNVVKLGSVITQINTIPVNNTRDVQYLITRSKRKGRASILLRVQDGPRQLFLAVKMR